MKTAADYTTLLEQLLPGGRIWPRDDDSTLHKILAGFAEELARIEARAYDLLDESDTRTIDELIEEYESEFGLPNACIQELGNTLSDRRNTIRAMILGRGRLNAAFFVELAATLNVTLTITTYRPAWSGVMVSGDPCGDQWVIFVWDAGSNPFFDATTALPYGTYLGTVGPGFSLGFSGGFRSYNGPLWWTTVDISNCLLAQGNPAWTLLRTKEAGQGYSRGFNCGFDALPCNRPSDLEGGFSRGFGFGIDVFYNAGFQYGAFSDGFARPSH